MEMVRHDDERVKQEPSLITIVKDCSFQQFRVRCDLKETTALRRDGGDKVRTSFLRRKSHVGSITDKPRG